MESNFDNESFGSTSSHVIPPVKIHPFSTFLPFLIDPLRINNQQIRTTNKQVKILIVVTGILTLAVLALTGVLIHSSLKVNSNNPVNSSPSTYDGLEK